MDVLGVLKHSNFGERVAEEEIENLASYFVETDDWRRLYNDQVDVVYGPKGSGKSALYSLLVTKSDSLFDRDILLAPGENPRGATAFRSLVADPPNSENEFIALWKLYLACIVSLKIEEFGISSTESNELRDALEEAGLRARKQDLSGLLQSVFRYVKNILRPGSVESGVTLDGMTQQVTGYAKINFTEPSDSDFKRGVVTVDRLMDLANTALEKNNIKVWIVLDRLDVAFLDTQELEQNALRALFHVYLDLMRFRNIKLKIFLRTDIWKKITEQGFREASHITRTLTIRWNEDSLFNLIVRRIVQNDIILNYYNTTKDEVLVTANEQEAFFGKIFPHQIEVGERKPLTFRWMLGRTRDATQLNAPRELIHLLNCIREEQIRNLEIGRNAPESNNLFNKSIFKTALEEVSRVRLEQTIYAEYPETKLYIEKLRNEKTQHGVDSLNDIWGTNEDETKLIANKLVDIGFFEPRGERAEPIYWVPLIYRDTLALVQGAA